jgi:hypothetical protein
MKKNFSISTWILIVLLAASCQKEIRETKQDAESREADLQSEKIKERNSGSECRLTSFTYPEGTYQYHYNRKALADEWNISDYGLFKQEYDRDGKLKKSRLYVSGELIYTIHFFYNHKGDPVKEIWYYGDTGEIYDETFYSYNRAGKMIRGESYLGDYYTITHYTDDGDVSDWTFYFAGSPYMSGQYKYKQKFKNVYRAVPGIEYGFPFINQSTDFKWWPTAEKIISYEEDGSPVVIHDFDPKKTIWTEAAHQYPASATYFDRVTGEWTPYTFAYENCGGHGHDGHGDNKITGTSSSASAILNKSTGRIKTKLILSFGKAIAEKVMRGRK